VASPVELGKIVGMSSSQQSNSVQVAIDNSGEEVVDKMRALADALQDLHDAATNHLDLAQSLWTINQRLDVPIASVCLMPHAMVMEVKQLLQRHIELFDELIPVVDNTQSLPAPPELFDLKGQTILDCALTLLQEAAPDPVHYATLAQQAFNRGYRSPRGFSDPETLARNFWDALRRIKEDVDIPIWFDGNGRFHYEPNKLQFFIDAEQQENEAFR
jgi:hypothetical protein